MCELDMPDRSSKMLLLAIRETVLAIVVDYRKDQSENFISIQCLLYHAIDLSGTETFSSV